MGSRIGITEESWGPNSDQRWLATRMGLTDMRSITLDISAFAAGHYAAGFIPSGTALGKITASGLYGPYDKDEDDGRETCAGLLFDDVSVVRNTLSGQTTLGDATAALYWTGVVKTEFLPDFDPLTTGEVDAAAKADLPMIRWE